SWRAIAHLELLPGDFIILLGQAGWAVYTVYGKRVLAVHSPAVATTAAYVLGSVMLLPVPFLTARFFPAPDWTSATAWAVVAIQGILGAIAHVWWYEGVHRVGASRAGIFMNLQPVVGVVLAWVMLGETIEPAEIVGGLARLGQLAACVALDEAHRALRVHDEGRPHIGVPLRPVHAVVLRRRAVRVGQQRIVRDTHGFGPVLVAEGTIGTDTQHLGIRRLEVAHALIEGRHALGSAGGPVQRIEQEHDVLAAEVPETHVLEPDALEREIGRGVAYRQLRVAHRPSPPFALRNGRRSSSGSASRR